MHSAEELTKFVEKLNPIIDFPGVKQFFRTYAPSSMDLRVSYASAEGRKTKASRGEQLGNGGRAGDGQGI